MSEKKSKYDSPFDSIGKVVGITATVAIHLLLIGIAFISGLNYTYPPPPEQGILIDFSEEIVEAKPTVSTGSLEPRAKDASAENEIKLIQQSQAPIEAEESTHGDETTLGEEGDVEVPEPPRKKEIDQRAIFRSNRHSKDTIAPQAAQKATDELKGGHIDGNTTSGNVDGAPTARLKGRSVKGYLPLPGYNVQTEGTVVVTIKVDNYGNVIDATPGAPGTNVYNTDLYKSAKEAALKAKFNISEDAPAVQEGTITYIFKLK